MRKIAFLVFFLLITLIGSAQVTTKSGVSQSANKIAQALYYINNFYLDTVDFNKLSEEAIKKLLSELDPHSSYISAKDVKAMSEPLDGEFEGIGIEFAIIQDTLTVQAPISGGPSEKVGIIAGDKIVKINGENVAGISLTNEQVFKYLRGAKGTIVELSILRKEEKELIAFTVVRDKIPIFSLDAVYQVTPGVLYMKLSRFAATSGDEIRKAITEFQKESKGKVKGMILDLRGNSGGNLHTSIDIANEFLNSGDMILYTEGRVAPSMKEYANGTGHYKSGALVVLIDENSASASEIVAGAIQDWDRGLIIGRRSFGKGLVQQQLPLNDGSVLRLTIARFHIPSGRVIQSPYEAGNIEKYYRDYYERFVKGESFSKDSIHFPDSLKYKTLRKGRTVFGGGGIMPDIFVPQDTSYYTPYYASLIRRGVVIEFINKSVDSKRAEWLNKYKTFDIFDKKFLITEELFSGLVTMAKEKGVEPNEEQIKKSEGEIKVYMKALIASALFKRDDFYKVINSDRDIVYKKALEVIEDWESAAAEL